MKTKIIFGALLTISVLMMLPAISAIEYNTTEVTYASIQNEQNNADFEELEEKIEDNSFTNKGIRSFLLLWILAKNLRRIMILLFIISFISTIIKMRNLK